MIRLSSGFGLDRGAYAKWLEWQSRRRSDKRSKFTSEFSRPALSQSTSTTSPPMSTSLQTISSDSSLLMRTLSKLYASLFLNTIHCCERCYDSLPPPHECLFNQVKKEGITLHYRFVATRVYIIVTQALNTQVERI
jgi:hypothetical protein